MTAFLEKLSMQSLLIFLFLWSGGDNIYNVIKHIIASAIDIILFTLFVHATSISCVLELLKNMWSASFPRQEYNHPAICWLRDKEKGIWDEGVEITLGGDCEDHFTAGVSIDIRKYKSKSP